MIPPPAMTLRRFVLLAAALAAGVGSASFETWATIRHRAQPLALRQHATLLEKQIAATRARLDATRSELASTERELAALPALADTDASRARDFEVAAWLARVQTLNQLLTQNPAQRIPELQLLDDEDWLNASRSVETDTEEHRRLALANLRCRAKQRFISLLSPALRKYAGASQGQPPPVVPALAPYFDPPVDPAILARYDIVRASFPVNLYSAWSIQESSAVDADYDDRVSVYANGSIGVTKAPVAWIPDFNVRSQRAFLAFAEANRAPPKDPTQLIPYFNPPLDLATIEKILEAESRREP